jgi:hypothetical protein
VSPRRPSPAPFQQPDGRPLLATVTKAAEWLPATCTEITATIQRAGVQVAAVDAWGAQTYRMIELETALGVKRPTPGRRRPFDGAIGGTSGATGARRGAREGQEASGPWSPPAAWDGRPATGCKGGGCRDRRLRPGPADGRLQHRPRAPVGRRRPQRGLYAISEGLAVMTGECPVHGHHQDVVLSPVNGQLHALARRRTPRSSASCSSVTPA